MIVGYAVGVCRADIEAVKKLGFFEATKPTSLVEVNVLSSFSPSPRKGQNIPTKHDGLMGHH